MISDQIDIVWRRDSVGWQQGTEFENWHRNVELAEKTLILPLWGESMSYLYTETIVTPWLR